MGTREIEIEKGKGEQEEDREQRNYMCGVCLRDINARARARARARPVPHPSRVCRHVYTLFTYTLATTEHP